MPKPEQNTSPVAAGQVWRDNKRGVTFIINEVVSKNGKQYAKAVRAGTGIESNIRLDRLKSRKKPNATSGYTRLDAGTTAGLPVPALGEVS